MRKPDINNVEVDMVPLIDIISLLLMFLIIVGDTTASSNIASLRLPTADQAKTEIEWKIDTKDRIVIQIKPEFENEDDQLKKNGKYFTVFNSSKHEGGDADKSLYNHLKNVVDDVVSKNPSRMTPEGTISIPVKLRIPASCPMVEAEKVLYTVASLKLVNIQYAASGKDEKRK